MTTAELLRSTKVPDTKSIFVLGCLESRVTVLSQQIRALNLVDAIIEHGLVRPNGAVAIVGGGAAGVTAAAALALALPDLRAIDIYEQKDDLLHLQLRSPDRYLHPHVYDWPARGSLRPDAGLPILNWRAGTAGEVAADILATFNEVRRARAAIRAKLGHQVDRVQAAPHGGCRVSVVGNPHGGDFYDIAILSVGFGYERRITEQNRSYWDPHQLSGPIRKDESCHPILVSGNGDGGLVDFLTAAFRGRSHREICEFITGYPGLHAAEAALTAIEERAWQGEPGDVDIYAEYQQHVLRELPDNMLLEVAEMLRPSVTVMFHTRTAQLFRRDTAVLNRFAALLAITATANRFSNSIELVRGAEFVTDAMAATVSFDSGAEIEPSFRFLRFGADTEKNLRPFEDYVQALRGARGAPGPGYRPATPALTDSARARFAGFSGRFGSTATAGRAPVGTRATSGPIRVYLHGLEDGRCVWTGDITPAEVGRVWRDASSPLVLTCDIPVDAAGSLRPLVARLAAHAPAYELYCPPGWTEYLQRYTDQALPGPGVEVRFAVRLVTSGPPAAAHRLTLDHGALAAEAHAALDGDVLDRLHRELRACLQAQPRRHFGWDVEASLRALCLAKWESWHRALSADPDARWRFLTLLASLDAARRSRTTGG
jgi:hypothetical protein